MPTDNDFDLRNITAAIRNPATGEYETIHMTPADVGEVTIDPEYGNIAISADEYPPYLTINHNNEAFSQDLMDLVSRVGNNHHWYDDRLDAIRYVPGEVVNVSPDEWAAINTTSANAFNDLYAFSRAEFANLIRDNIEQSNKEKAEREIPASEEDLCAFLADCGVLKEAV